MQPSTILKWYHTLHNSTDMKFYYSTSKVGLWHSSNFWGVTILTHKSHEPFILRGKLGHSDTLTCFRFLYKRSRLQYTLKVKVEGHCNVIQCKWGYDIQSKQNVWIKGQSWRSLQCKLGRMYSFKDTVYE